MKAVFAERIIQALSIVMFFSAVAFFVYTAEAQQTDSFCHTITRAEDVPEKFASPIDFFSGSQNLLMTAECFGDRLVTMRAGSGDSSQYIYKYGYRKADGKWKRIEFSGPQAVGPWLVGSALVSAEDVHSSESISFLAYICQRVGGVWKCGCGDRACNKAMWNIQKYVYTEAQNSEEGEADSGDISTNQEEFDIEDYLENFNSDNKILSEFVESNFDITIDELRDVLTKEHDPNILDVYTTSSNMGFPGDVITLTGSGFKKSASNDILWNGDVIQRGVPSNNGTSLSITVPSLEPGKYDVKVRADGETSKYGVVIWIRTPGTMPPTIDRITPEKGEQGDTLTVYGRGFTKENNDVVTTFGVVPGLPSEDGTSITFEYSPFKEPIKFYHENGDLNHYAQPIYFYVFNTSGKSGSKVFYLNI